MKRFPYVLVFLFLSNSLMAQDDKQADPNWKKGLDVSSSFMQSSFTNWTEGGADNMTVGILANIYGNFKKDKLSWDNNLLFQYSMQKIQKAPFVKNVDKLEYTSFAGLKAYKNWYYSLLLSLKTQSSATWGIDATGNALFKSGFMAPGELMVGPGMKYDKTVKNKNQKLFANISPATLKATFVLSPFLSENHTFIPRIYNDADELLNEGATYRMEIGASVLAGYSIDLTKNVSYKTNVELFSNYLYNPQNIDVKWQNFVSINVMKIITITASADLRYDHDVAVPLTEDGVAVLNSLGEQKTGPRTRFAQTFGIGIGYKFSL